MSSPLLHNVPPAVTRSNSITSTNSTSSGVSLRRRPRTQTRTLSRDARRTKSVGPPSESSRRGTGTATAVRRLSFSARARQLTRRHGLISPLTARMPSYHNLTFHHSRRASPQLLQNPPRDPAKKARSSSCRQSENVHGVRSTYATFRLKLVAGEEQSQTVVHHQKYVP